MKKITVLMALMITSLGFSQSYLPFTFTNADQLMTGQGGTGTSLVPDPASATNQVMQIVGGTDTWDNAIIDLNPSVNLQDDANNTISFRINPIGITGVRQHLIKFEGPGQVEYFFTTTGSGWQTITYNYPSGLAAYGKMVIFTDSGAESNGFANANTGTYLIDDIMGGTNNPLSGGVSLPLTFSSADQLFTGNGAPTSLVPDPMDATNQVMQIDGSVGDNWNNAVKNLNPGVNLSDDANNTITFRINPIGVTGVHSHLLKFEGAGATEFFFTTTGSGWQTITADFASGLGTYPTIVVFPDAATLDTGMYLVDDFKFASALSAPKFDKASIKMYPNPMKNTLTIEANSSIQRVSVYNVLGQEVMKASPKTNSTTLQTSQLQKGVYMVTTEIEGVISTSKMLKE
ncbi:T9SS type A sorting domain-containing protein [Flavobacterium sp.]|uniref:T9SS type A sorting domain-containing protein n=1 Tax=Flavobacterium sp. TaxID=239 RepID=UPI00286E8A69|nr:T9SS type A sorting domain-containing protein [Flavobacterium sp.]